MKHYLTALLLIACINSFGQNLTKSTKELMTIDSILQIKQLKEKHPHWLIEFYVIEKNALELDSQLNKLEIGDITTIAKGNDTYTYKLLDADTIKEFRADHIFLNGRLLSLNKIDTLQKLIIDKYNGGESFKDLVQQYTMYQKPIKYFSDWFKPGMMVKEFEDEVKNHQKGAIFSLDIISKKWHYVVLKTHENRETIKLKLVCITNQ